MKWLNKIHNKILKYSNILWLLEMIQYDTNFVKCWMHVKIPEKLTQILTWINSSYL